MTWIELHSTLRDHPKTHGLGERLGIGRAEAVGSVASLWLWAADYAPDGDLAAFDAAQVARAAGWRTDAAVFVEALVAVRFLDRTDGRLVIHDWPEYRLHFDAARERADRQREQVRDRVRRFRERKRNAAVTQGVTPGNAPKYITKPTKPKDITDPSPEAKALTSKLVELMRRNDPSAKFPPDLSSWEREADRLLRLDGRTPGEAMAVLEWCQQDHFWKANVLSMGTFRKQFALLRLRREGERAKATPLNRVAPQEDKYRGVIENG